MFRPFPAPSKRIKVAAVISLGTAVLTAAALAGASSAATVSSPWNQSNYNAAQSRANLTEQTLTPATVSGARYLRSIAGPPLTGAVCFITPDTLMPVLSGGNLYALNNGRVFKASAATGQLLWRRTPDATFSTVLRSISVANGLVVVGEVGCGSASDPQGFLQAFNASTGASVWKTPITTLGGPLATAAVSGSYVAADGDSAGGGELVAVHSLSTGAQIWAHGTDGCIETNGNVLVVAQQVIFNTCDPAAEGNPVLMAKAIGTGTTTWHLAGAWHLWRGGAGTLTGRNLVVTNPSGTVVDLNPLTGATRFALTGATKVLAIDTARVYTDCGPDLCAYSTTSGALLWRLSGVAAALAAEGGGVLYLDHGQVLSAQTGKLITELWAPSLGIAATALVVGDGRVADVTDPRVADLYGLSGF